MPRQHTIGGTDTDGNLFEVNIPYTVDEENARDMEEAESLIEDAARKTKQANLDSLVKELRNDTITDIGVRDLLRHLFGVGN